MSTPESQEKPGLSSKTSEYFRQRTAVKTIGFGDRAATGVRRSNLQDDLFTAVLVGSRRTGNIRGMTSSAAHRKTTGRACTNPRPRAHKSRTRKARGFVVRDSSSAFGQRLCGFCWGSTQINIQDYRNWGIYSNCLLHTLAGDPSGRISSYSSKDGFERGRESLTKRNESVPTSADFGFPTWEPAFRAAWTERDKTKLPVLLDAAEGAIFKRLQELQESDDHAVERAAIHDATCVLRVIQRYMLDYPAWKGEL